MGGTVGGLSPRWRVVSLPLPHLGHALLLVSQLVAVYHTLYISFFHHFMSPHPHATDSKLIINICSNFLCIDSTQFPGSDGHYCRISLSYPIPTFSAVLTPQGRLSLQLNHSNAHKPRGLLPVGALLIRAHVLAQRTGLRCP